MYVYVRKVGFSNTSIVKLVIQSCLANISPGIYSGQNIGKTKLYFYTLELEKPTFLMTAPQRSHHCIRRECTSSMYNIMYTCCTYCTCMLLTYYTLLIIHFSMYKYLDDVKYKNIVCSYVLPHLKLKLKQSIIIVMQSSPGLQKYTAHNYIHPVHSLPTYMFKFTHINVHTYITMNGLLYNLIPDICCV